MKRPASRADNTIVFDRSRAGIVTMKTMATPIRSFARRITHYLQALYTPYEWRCGVKFCSDTIVHTMLTLPRSRLAMALRAP
jgi:hypothetical protein